MKKLPLAALALGAVLLASCAPKYTTATQKPVSDMACTEIGAEVAQLKNLRAEAESKTGLSRQNVAWAIFFWPGALINEADNRDVIQKVDVRTKELLDAGRAKGCNFG